MKARSIIIFSLFLSTVVCAQQQLLHINVNHPKLEIDSLPDFNSAVPPYGKYTINGFPTTIHQDKLFKMFPKGFVTAIYFQKPGDTELFYINRRPNLKKFQLAGNGTYYLLSGDGQGMVYIHRLRMSGKNTVEQKACLIDQALIEVKYQ